MLCEDFRDRVVATKDKARINRPKMGDTSGLLASQGRECVSSATILDILDRIGLRDREPRALGHHSPSH